MKSSRYLFFIGLAVVLGFSLPIRRWRVKHPSGPQLSSGPAALSLTKTLAAAAFLFGFDGILSGQDFISTDVSFGVLCWAAVAIPLARKNRPLMVFRAKKTGILIFAALAVIGFVEVQRGISEQRVKRVISAVRQYHEKTGKFPDQLSDITPGFLPSIPDARISLMQAKIEYIAEDGDHVIYIYVMPPFGRRRWTTLD